MMRSPGTLSAKVRELLDEEVAIPALPAAARARAVARARAAIEADFGAPATPTERASAAVPARWAASIALALAASAAVGAVAYGVAHWTSEKAPVEAHPAMVGASPKTSVPAAIPTPIDEPPPPPRSHGLPLRLSPAGAIHAELLLLRPARAAVARGDFAAALHPIAEHARRFKDGRLAEEREALRVKALVGLGRTDEARLAAAGFRAHFPHSVLLRAIGQISPGGE